MFNFSVAHSRHQSFLCHVCTILKHYLFPPQILVLSSQKLLLDLGYYKMILYTFYVEGVMAMVMLALGPQHHYVLAVFLSVNM